MIKKLIALFIVITASSSLLAETKTSLIQTLPFTIRNGATWFIANPSGTITIRFAVNKTLNGRNIPSDPITFLCDKAYTVAPGNSITCKLSNHIQGEFRIANYANGSDGTYTVS